MSLGHGATARAQSQDDERLVCAQAAEAGQELRDKGRLLDALAQFQRCARDSCPSVITGDCVRFATQTDALLPSAVFRVIDEQGRDLTAVTVSVDGKVVTRTVGGRAYAVDPGPHQVRFEIEGRPPISAKFVAVEGEKARPVQVTLHDPRGVSATKDEPPGLGGPPVASWILGGVGVASLGGFAYFGLNAKSEHDDLEATCGLSATCSDDQVDGFRRKAVVADVLLGVSVASLAAAGVVWAVSEEPSREVSSASSLSLVVQPSGGTLAWRGVFQ